MDEKIYLRPLLSDHCRPSEACERESNWAAWIVGHPHIDNLSNTVFDHLWHQFINNPELDNDVKNFGMFIEHLKEQGYTIYNVGLPGIWTPIR